MGHLRLAEDVREKFELDRVLFIPTNVPPHKEMKVSAGPEERLKMVALSVRHNPAFMCDDIEIRRGGNSYTIDTVRYIYENYTFTDKPFFIVGSDLLPELHTWKNIDELAGMVEFIVLVREHYPVEGGKLDDIMNLKMHQFDNRHLDINSSEIRDRLTRGRSIRYLVTDRVHGYIKRKKLYR
jgi:nicotinate-nucleotide adenylyltransferase